MESPQIILGMNHQIFQLSYEKYDIMAPSSWISHLWQMSYEYNVQIIGFYEWTHPVQVNDKALWTW